jgi:hypothetical protein
MLNSSAFDNSRPDGIPVLEIAVHGEPAEGTARRFVPLREGGARPLNLSRRSGEAVQVVLADPQGEWTAGAPAMFVSRYW